MVVVPILEVMVGQVQTRCLVAAVAVAVEPTVPLFNPVPVDAAVTAMSSSSQPFPPSPVPVAVVSVPPAPLVPKVPKVSQEQPVPKAQPVLSV